MDISELQIKINKNQAVGDLKAVESQLDKTGKAADSLIDTLKNIGLTVGFGKLVKDSLQLNNQFSSLSNKFQSIFKGGIDTKVFSNLKNELSLSDSALKNILATTGQFAKGLGQSSQFVKNFSVDLTKAAADYAAYQGKTSAADANEYARKFAKATLGEVGELKEIGIIVDTTSAQFQKAVKTFQETTGATEAQAKQMEILKQIIEQTQVASDSASKNMYDGWTQLNKLFDQFKEILGEVGSIFSSVFGPLLHTLNAILEIPFVKSTLAWGIAVGSVSVGYISLMSVLHKIAAISAAQYTSSSKILNDTKLITGFSREWNNEVQKVREAYDRISIVARKTAGIKRSSFNNMTGPEKKMFTQTLQVQAPSLFQELTHVQDGFKNLKERIAASGLTIDEITSLNLPDLNQSMLQWIETEENAKKTLQGVSQTAGKNSGMFVSLGATLQSINSKIPNIVGGLGSFFRSLKSIFSGGLPALLTGLKTGFKAILAPALAIIGKLAAIAGVFIIVHDLIKGIVNLFSGKNFQSGSLSASIAEYIMARTELAKTNKERAEWIGKVSTDFKKLNNNIKTLEKKIKDVNFEKQLSTLPLQKRLIVLNTQLKNTKSLDSFSIKIKELKKQLEENIATSNSLFAIPDADKRKTAMAAAEEQRAKIEAEIGRVSQEYNEVLNKRTSLEQQIKSTEEEIAKRREKTIQLNIEYAKSLDKLKVQFNSALKDFAYGFKDGQFGNFTEDKAQLDRIKRLQELQNRLKLFENVNNLQSYKLQEETSQEIFKLTQEKAKYELDALWKQREAAIQNVKIMNDIIKEASSFRQTSQTAVEASSIQAIALQSRKMDSFTGKELAPIINEQKQVKEINRQILDKQGKAVSALDKVNQSLIKVAQKIGGASGATNVNIQAINPL